VIEILVKRRISLPLPDSFLQGPGLGFLALTPEQHVASLLQERLEPIQDKAVPLFLDATLSSLFSQTMGEAAQTRIRMVAELRSSLLPNAQEEGPLGPRSMPLPPPQMGREWVAARLGTTRGILDQWAEAAHLYGREIGGQSSTLLFDPPIVDAEGRVSDPGGYEPILVERAILVFARVLSEGGVSPVSFMQRTAEVTGRTPAEIAVWWQRIPDEWKKLSQEGRKDPPELLLQVLLPAKNHMLWKSRGAKQRQAMVIACLTERGYADPREVIREVASWDWETASRPQKTLIDILFKPVNEGGAGFRLRARGGDDEGTPT